MFISGKDIRGKHAEAIILFKNCPQWQIEDILNHEYIHLALCHIGEDPDLLDRSFTLTFTVPWMVEDVIDTWMNGDVDAIEGLEYASKASSSFGSCHRKQRKRTFPTTVKRLNRKHDYIVV